MNVISSSQTRWRQRLALATAGLAALILFTLLAWLIHHRDWGIVLMALVPLAVWLTLRLWRRLARWALRG